MPRIRRLLLALGCACCAAVAAGQSPAAALEYNPVRKEPMVIGPEANRLIVGFRATPSNTLAKTVRFARRARSVTVIQAQTSAADVQSLVKRVGLTIARSGQITPSMHVLYMPKTLYGGDVVNALAALRADPAVQFATVDGRRYALQKIPDDPLFQPTTGANGQWYFNNPATSSITVSGTIYQDLSATDAVDAWTSTTGTAGIVIADVDTGIRFDHPDLLRAGLGGRLLPGYDFVGQDYNPNSPYNALGTFDIANDGDGWDPDPSDPGDWISQTDIDNPNGLFANDAIANSSWHGTRVVGIFGALTNNDVGIAGMTWGSWVLPVRALGKGGGYDSDIIAGIEWAAGMPGVTDPDTGASVPDNPYPADIINLSLGGGTDACTSSDGQAYETAFQTVTGMGVLVVIAAGNASGPVELPGNCATVVPGVMAVAGLRNVGTKVGYSSLGAQVSVSAPAGNCINTTGDCLRSMDSTTNTGLTTPVLAVNGGDTYTNETNYNVGTSFATPLVSGIAALMRSVNDNLTPAQLQARIEASAAAFPPAGTEPVCPTTDADNECSCPASGQCGTGMVNANSAVQAALAPIAAVAITGGSSLNASGSAASCGRTVASYAWAATGGATVTPSTGDTATVSGSGTVTLTVKDSAGATDTATITVASGSATSSAPTSAGTSASACPTALTVTPIPPTVAQAFSPASTGPGLASTLTFTFNNANAYALTQSNFTDTLPGAVTVLGSPAAATTCTGSNAALSAAGSTVTLTDANIPANGSCTVTVSVSGSAPGSYANTIAANALMTGPAGGNAAAPSSTLTVTTPNRPAVAEAFSPASIAQNGTSTLTITLSNSNAYALTGVGLTHALVSGLTAKSTPAAVNTCGGTLPAPTSSVTLSGASIPASSSCTVALTVSSGTAGSYKDTIAAGAVTTALAGSNAAPATATLAVTASGGGGGALDWFDVMFVAGVLLVGRGHAARRRLGRGEGSEWP